jgi:hypothetical protein
MLRGDHIERGRVKEVRVNMVDVLCRIFKSVEIAIRRGLR